MSTAMSKHLTEDALILHYYGESDEAPAIETHLAGCPACREELERLRRVLALVDVQEIPEPGPAFEREVWARLAPQLEAHRRSWLSRVFPAGRHWVLAGGVAALLLAAFVAGRWSQPEPAAPAVAEAPADVSDRVLVVAVVDHLDRSQMMLLELINGEPGRGTSDLGVEQSRARELVAENRLYRVSAAQAGDEAVTDVLDELERALLEIANAPQNTSAEQFEALRQRIAARGLLFKVRVVHSEMRERERRTLGTGSTS